MWLFSSENGFVSVNFGCVVRQSVGKFLGKTVIVSMVYAVFDAACKPTRLKGGHCAASGDKNDELHLDQPSVDGRLAFCYALRSNPSFGSRGSEKVASCHLGLLNSPGSYRTSLCRNRGSVRAGSRSFHGVDVDWKCGVALPDQPAHDTRDTCLPHEAITPTPVGFVPAGDFFRKCGSSLVKIPRAASPSTAPKQRTIKAVVL